MAKGKAGYLGGAIAGFTLGMFASLIITPQANSDLLAESGHWLTLNMGSSAWLFGMVLLAWGANLTRLENLLQERTEFKRIVQLDQLSDIWIHLFVGIGVIWTAVGMRSALSTTLAVPDQLTADAGTVLSRLVDGGILLALTTTIVGAIGGYLMRLAKTLFIGSELTAYYHAEEKRDLHRALAHLEHIEAYLQMLTPAPVHINGARCPSPDDAEPAHRAHSDELSSDTGEWPHAAADSQYTA